MLAVAFSSAASAKNGRRKDKRPKKLLSKATGPVTLTLESVDFAAAQAQVVVGGVRFEPEGRLFTFHDDKDRHFIALDAHCAPEGDKLRCTLDLPRPYLGKSRVLGMTINAKGHDVEASAEEVQSKFAAARAAAAGATPAASPGAVASPAASDAGATTTATPPAVDATAAPVDAGTPARSWWHR